MARHDPRTGVVGWKTPMSGIGVLRERFRLFDLDLFSGFAMPITRVIFE
ncbi:hypothetical protein ACGFYU_28850 [Streptomyces sp. NPDC048337]